MADRKRLSDAMKRLLRCPVCRSALVSTADGYECTRPDCAASYPVIDGIAVLINEHASVFSIDDFVQRRNTYFPLSTEEGFVAFVKSIIPDVSANTQARRNYRRLAALLLSTSDSPSVLVLGGSIIGPRHGRAAEPPFHRTGRDRYIV